MTNVQKNEQIFGLISRRKLVSRPILQNTFITTLYLMYVCYIGLPKNVHIIYRKWSYTWKAVGSVGDIFCSTVAGLLMTAAFQFWIRNENATNISTVLTVLVSFQKQPFNTYAWFVFYFLSLPCFLNRPKISSRVTPCFRTDV